jgi:hypothetical protein
MDRDIFRCQKMQKLRLALFYVLIRTICMVLDSLMKMGWSLCFILDRLFVISRVMAVSLPVSEVGEGAQFHTRTHFHALLYQNFNFYSLALFGSNTGPYFSPIGFTVMPFEICHDSPHFRNVFS